MGRTTKEIRKHFDLNENKNAAHENFWDSSTAVLQVQFIELNAYIRKEERSQIYDLSLKNLKMNKLNLKANRIKVKI